MQRGKKIKLLANEIKGTVQMTADVRLCFYLFVNKHIRGSCVAFFEISDFKSLK